MADGEELYEEEVGAEGYEEEEEQEEAGAGEEYGEGEATAEDLEAMQRKLKEMEEEAARLKAVVGAGSDGAATAAGTAATAAAAAAAAAANTAADLAAKAEVDSRSIYIGSVDYACTPEELQQHFAQCGTVNRVTILTDRFGSPKGYAYLEFLEVDAVQNALLLDNSELRGRQIKVSAKRTNQPGLKVRGRGRGRGFPPAYGGRGFYPPPFAGGRGRGGYYGGYYGAPGYAPRGRGRGRGAFYAPY